MRKLLRYEITGLAMIVHIFLVVILFWSSDEILYLIDHVTDLAATIGLISLLIGWLSYQIFEEIYKPHYNTPSFKLIKKMCQDLKNTERFALVDFILMDDMYQKYPGLADTIGGYWDHYYSNSIIGIGVPCISALSFIILLLIEMAGYTNYIVCPCGSALRFICMAILIIYNVSLYVLLWQIKANRIFKEIEFRECLYIRNNMAKLYETPLRDYISDCSHLLTRGHSK